MKPSIAAALILIAAPVFAHSGPESALSHFTEHLLLALVLGLPAGIGLWRLLRRSGTQH
jgi:hypothetical protein